MLDGAQFADGIAELAPFIRAIDVELQGQEYVVDAADNEEPPPTDETEGDDDELL